MITKKVVNGVTTYEVQDAKGNTVELTSEVFQDIFFYKRREFHKEDIISTAEELYEAESIEKELSEAEIESATSMYEKFLENDDSWNVWATDAIQTIVRPINKS